MAPGGSLSPARGGALRCLAGKPPPWPTARLLVSAGMRGLGCVSRSDCVTLLSPEVVQTQGSDGSRAHSPHPERIQIPNQSPAGPRAPRGPSPPPITAGISGAGAPSWAACKSDCTAAAPVCGLWAQCQVVKLGCCSSGWRRVPRLRLRAYPSYCWRSLGWLPDVGCCGHCHTERSGTGLVLGTRWPFSWLCTRDWNFWGEGHACAPRWTPSDRPPDCGALDTPWRNVRVLAAPLLAHTLKTAAALMGVRSLVLWY